MNSLQSLELWDKDLQKENHVGNLNAEKFYITVFTLILLVMSGLKAQSELSNLTLAEQMYTQVIDSLLVGVPEPELNVSGLSADMQTFLRSGWIQYWASKTSIPVQDSTKSVFNMDKCNISITYHEDAWKLTGFKKQFKREFTISLRGWLEEKQSKKVLKSFLVQKTKMGFIEQEEMHQVENSPFIFTKGRMQTKSLWTRYIEPVLVTVSVVTMVYLFFSVRT